MSHSKARYEAWLAEKSLDEDLRRELLEIADNEEKIEDLFYKDLSFGTSGIRGKMAAGTAGLNVHVVARATQGIADYLNDQGPDPSCAIAYDSRIHSRDFAEVTARVLCANGIRVHMFQEITPVAALSYGIRELGLTMGIMITASHNPKEYNGYKVYDQEGCQIVGEAPRAIWQRISALDYFDDIKAHLAPLERSPLFSYIDESILAGYLQQAQEQSLPQGGMEDLRVVYTPLHGSGDRFVTEALLRAGTGHVYKVHSQQAPDGDFPGCPIPNPERIENFAEGEKLCDRVEGDLILATDPDCDRVGVAVRRARHPLAPYWYPTGNQLGILLCQYLCEHRENVAGKTVVRSIVSSPLIDRIAVKYGARVETTLTGFKYIGQKMNALGENFLFGFEEGNGYLAATHVRDKDGVSASVLIAQMAAYYKSQGLDLFEALHAIYQEHGYIREETRGFTFEGKKGDARIEIIMTGLREDKERYYPAADYQVRDYEEGLDGLPPANVLEFIKNDSEKTILRPSGTEPKIKAYVFAHGESKEEVRHLLDEAESIVDRVMGEEE